MYMYACSVPQLQFYSKMSPSPLPQGALAGIFCQITGDDEGVREKGMEYVSTSLMSMRHRLFIPHQENEKFLLEQIKKVIQHLVLFMAISTIISSVRSNHEI